MNTPESNAVDQAATLRRLTQRRTRNNSASVKLPKTLAVSSGKGGVGKTMLSVNLALRFAGQGVRTLLVDLDPGLANVDVHLRLQSRFDVDDLLAGDCSAEDAVLIADRGLRVLPGGRMSEVERSEIQTARTQDGPRRILERLAPLHKDLDLIILDTGAGLGPWVNGALEVATSNLVVTQSDPASVTDAYSVIKVAKMLKTASDPSIVVNRVADKHEALLTATRLRSVAAQFLGFQPELLGWVHDRAVIASSTRSQVPFTMQLEANHAANLELAGLAARIADSMKLPIGTTPSKTTRAASTH